MNKILKNKNKLIRLAKHYNISDLVIKRLIKHYIYNMTISQIAIEEHVENISIKQSIRRAKRKMSL